MNMDVRIEAAPAVATAAVVQPVVTVPVKVFTPSRAVREFASFSCPSMGSHSISAVAPDHTFEGGTALAAA